MSHWSIEAHNMATSGWVQTVPQRGMSGELWADDHLPEYQPPSEAEIAAQRAALLAWAALWHQRYPGLPNA